ncbi:hypothetical protein T05_15364 [Trichinella murrelli]|uniref:Uncharacterized protein n=1 Tax=Trichinella murrelli TaxID=144512 RepID=A0A0V0TIS9_9BILA|nr:hypothetical protein T05_15364 [Trichinella murrelli]
MDPRCTSTFPHFMLKQCPPPINKGFPCIAVEAEFKPSQPTKCIIQFSNGFPSKVSGVTNGRLTSVYCSDSAVPVYCANFPPSYRLGQ